MSYVAPNLRDKFESLPIALKNAILEKERTAEYYVRPYRGIGKNCCRRRIAFCSVTQ